MLLHELGHGLGFSSFLSRSGTTAGTTPNNFSDPYLDNTLDASTNTPFPALLGNPAATLAAIQKVDQIVWTGGNVAAAVPTTLLFGRPELDAPTLPAIDGSRYGTASFGPPIPPTGITGMVVVADDGISAPATPGPPATPAGTPTDACEPLTPASAAAVAGKIALVDRGLCGFIVKVKNAQHAGAIAVLVADNVAGQPAGRSRRRGSDDHDPVGARAAGDRQCDQGCAGPVTVTIGVNAAPARRDRSVRPAAALREHADCSRIDTQSLGSDRVQEPADGAGDQPGPHAQPDRAVRHDARPRCTTWAGSPTPTSTARKTRR